MNSSAQKFTGLHTALITPLKNGAIAWGDTEQLIEKQIESGVDGLVAVGTTGESPTLNHTEHVEFIRFVVDKVKGRVPVIAGTGSNSSEEAAMLTAEADNAGVDAMLQVAPYYNKPSQEGLFQHFSHVAKSTDKPILLYSIPGRCGIEISIEVMARLFEAHPHVLGVKEAGGSCDRVSQIQDALGSDYLILSGDDSLTLPFMTCGAKGVISVASNYLPKTISQMVHAALDNDYAKAIPISQQLYPLFTVLFIEANPVPVKYAMHRRGDLSSPEVRLPLCALHEQSSEAIDAVLDALKGINE